MSLPSRLARFTPPSLPLLAAGCEPEPRHVGGAKSPAPASTAPAPDQGVMVGKRTHDIRNWFDHRLM